jgi:sugar transferase (PEP-CTERM/EpsH1 system associated)
LKILIITPRIPYPPFRGDKLKIYNIIKILVKNNDVSIITFYQNSKDRNNLEAIRALGVEINLVRLTLIESLYQTFLAIFKSIPFQVAWYKSSKMKHKIESLLQREKFDVIYYHLIRTAQYLSSQKNNSKLNVIDFTDSVSLYLSRMVKQEKNYFKRSLFNSELRRIDKYEKIAENFDALFICSDVDRKFLLEKGVNQEIHILNNGIDIEYFSGDQIKYDPKRIIFTGNMPYFPNSDAVVYFSKEIFPIILKKDPDIKFFIVGQKPPRSVCRLASKNIIVTGYVKDIKTEYLKSMVNVAPMRFGAGTLNKVLESIALGIPVVATSSAVAGLPKELEKFVFIADTSIEFAKKVLEILDNEKIRSEQMREGTEIIKNLLDWNGIVGDFENFLLTKLDQKKKK